MTKTFDIIRSDPHASRSEALRRAMISYMNDTSDRGAPTQLFGDHSRLLAKAASDEYSLAPPSATALLATWLNRVIS